MNSSKSALTPAILTKWKGRVREEEGFESQTSELRVGHEGHQGVVALKHIVEDRWCTNGSAQSPDCVAGEVQLSVILRAVCVQEERGEFNVNVVIGGGKKLERAVDVMLVGFGIR